MASSAGPPSTCPRSRRVPTPAAALLVPASAAALLVPSGGPSRSRSGGLGWPAAESESARRPWEACRCRRADEDGAAGAAAPHALSTSRVPGSAAARNGPEALRRPRRRVYLGGRGAGVEHGGHGEGEEAPQPRPARALGRPVQPEEDGGEDRRAGLLRQGGVRGARREGLHRELRESAASCGSEGARRRPHARVAATVVWLAREPDATVDM
ncbi:hypothetical protein U9M48_013247 [Paspalum notatum var. saurae]|uniref:Uncharacterized protein n=1 Tax=Paspalum notatum var. saurae TaxID=547442 RepID=A0AAQ3T199_PASNO